MYKAATEYGILVGVDGSVGSDAAVRWAAAEAVMRNEPMTLMHVIAPVPDWATPSRQAYIAGVWEQKARDVIEQARKTVFASVGESDVPDVRAAVQHSSVVPALVNASKDAGMIVAGSHGMDALAAFFSAQSVPACFITPTARSPSFMVMQPQRSITSHRFCWASTGLPLRKMPPPWPSKRRRGEVCTLSHCTRGATSRFSRSSEWTGGNTKPKARKPWPSA